MAVHDLSAKDVVERLRPAAVVPDEVRLPARRLREFLDRLVGGRRPVLEDAQVRGRAEAAGRRARREGWTAGG